MMFKADIDLVKRLTEKYGYASPVVDLGGLARPTIAAYELTIATGDQYARYLHLPEGRRPFDWLSQDYEIVNPENGDPDIEQLAANMPAAYATLLCLNVIEHVENPFGVFASFYELARPSALVIVSTVFSFPYHPSPLDYWRYSPACLEMLARVSGFEVLESGMHLTVWGDAGIKEIRLGHAQEIQACFVCMRKPAE